MNCAIGNPAFHSRSAIDQLSAFGQFTLPLWTAVFSILKGGALFSQPFSMYRLRGPLRYVLKVEEVKGGDLSGKALGPSYPILPQQEEFYFYFVRQFRLPFEISFEDRYPH